MIIQKLVFAVPLIVGKKNLVEVKKWQVSHYFCTTRYENKHKDKLSINVSDVSRNSSLYTKAEWHN